MSPDELFIFIQDRLHGVQGSEHYYSVSANGKSSGRLITLQKDRKLGIGNVSN